VDCHVIWTKECSNDIPTCNVYGLLRLSWGSMCSLISKCNYIKFDCVLTSAKISVVVLT